ncbi:hypothetical protein BH11PSE8_BH11PSE8_33050 [soil metagenome]
MDLLTGIIGRGDYLPHGYCFTWTPSLLWALVGADVTIAGAYFSIPLAILTFVRKRDEPADNWLAWLFCAFIFACGLTHVMDVWTIWQPDYALQALTKIVTAVISLATAVLLWPLLPKALKIPSVARLQTVIGELEIEVRKRRSAEEHLADVQQTLSVTLASIGAGFIATDREGRVTRMNAIAEQVMGWTQAEARGRGLYEIYVREGRPEAQAASNPVDLTLSQGYTVETVHNVIAVSRHGLRTALEVKAAPTHSEDGSVRGIVMVFRDLTELMRAEAEAQRLAAIVESSSDAIIGKTLTGVITSWNLGAQLLFGYTEAQTVGRSMQMLIPPERADEESQILTRLARGERVEHFETVRLRRDGTLVDISSTISPVRDTAGRIIGASNIARDITERKNSDDRLKAQLQRLALLDHITRAVAERNDLHSIYQVTVRSLEEQLPADFACVLNHDEVTGQLIVRGIGTRADDQLPELANEPFVAIDPSRLERCLAGNLIHDVDTSALPYPLARRLAGSGLRSMVMAPLRSQSRAFGILVAARRRPHAFSSSECEFIRQLSEHVGLAAHHAHLHATLQATYDELRQTQQASMQQDRLRALGQMASGIAHDINNAISPAVLYAEGLLAREPLSERARGYVQSIARAMDDVAATVSRMREFYRGREARQQPGPVALNDLAHQVIELSRARWSDMPQQRGVVIEVREQLMHDLPPAWGVESEIREALINLVFNAIDAMPQGGSLTLFTRTAEEGGAPRVVIEVSDTGIGMDEATQRRCLEPFFTTKGERGTGLGLAMVYGTAQRHGAELGVVSTPGEGTTVRLAFPLQGMPLAEPAKASSRPTRRLRLLLVDDDPVLLRSLRDTLEGDGHVVRAANGGQAGIDAFAASLQVGEPFDAVITDLGMPHVDGRQVASAVKRLSPDTPVMLLTGWGQRMSEDGDAPPNVDVVLSKPPRLADLRIGLAQCTVSGDTP